MSFKVTVRDEGDAISINGETKFTWESLGLSAPTAGLVLTLSDDVEVRFDLKAKPVR